jgi:hypothetical protein
VIGWLEAKPAVKAMTNTGSQEVEAFCGVDDLTNIRELASLQPCGQSLQLLYSIGHTVIAKLHYFEGEIEYILACLSIVSLPTTWSLIKYQISNARAVL